MLISDASATMFSNVLWTGWIADVFILFITLMWKANIWNG